MDPMKVTNEIRLLLTKKAKHVMTNRNKIAKLNIIERLGIVCKASKPDNFLLS